MQIVLRGKNTMCKGRKAYGELRGTKDKEKMQRLRGEIKGAHSAKGGMKCTRADMKCEGGKKVQLLPKEKVKCVREHIRCEGGK